MESRSDSLLLVTGISADSSGYRDRELLLPAETTGLTFTMLHSFDGGARRAHATVEFAVKPATLVADCAWQDDGEIGAPLVIAGHFVHTRMQSRRLALHHSVSLW